MKLNTAFREFFDPNIAAVYDVIAQLHAVTKHFIVLFGSAKML